MKIKPRDFGIIVLLIVALIVMIGSVFLNDYIEAKETYVEENTSSIGVVVDKTYKTGFWGYRTASRSTRFYVTVERESVNIKGEKILKEDTLLVDYEEWVQIEIGDIATYRDDGSVTFDHPSEGGAEK